MQIRGAMRTVFHASMRKTPIIASTLTLAYKSKSDAQTIGRRARDDQHRRRDQRGEPYRSGNRLNLNS